MKIRRIRRSLSEMKIAKAKYHSQETFNDYDVELSWGQLQAIFHALEKDHSDPIADETYAELAYYLQNVPGPGESEDEYKEQAMAQKEASGLGEQPGMGDETRDLEGVGTELEGPEVGDEMEGAGPPIDGDPGFEPEPAEVGAGGGGGGEGGGEAGGVEDFMKAEPPTAGKGGGRYSPARGNVGRGNFESLSVDHLLEAPPRS